MVQSEKSHKNKSKCKKRGKKIVGSQRPRPTKSQKVRQIHTSQKWARLSGNKFGRSLTVRHGLQISLYIVYIYMFSWQFCERDLFGVVSSRDPSKGCWWPPTRKQKVTNWITWFWMILDNLRSLAKQLTSSSMPLKRENPGPLKLFQGRRLPVGVFEACQVMMWYMYNAWPNNILLMDKILNHLGCNIPCK